ncbi:hypothetical protein ACHAW6_007391 [Cyclotella cf. meneghiniana]
MILSSPPSAAITRRHVPPGPISLSSDAPGWSSSETNETGPVCWKCRGARTVRPLSRDVQRPNPDTRSRIEGTARTDLPPREAQTNRRPCPVCRGEGVLPMRSRRRSASSGSITARRKRPRGWDEAGHLPPAVGACADFTTSEPQETTSWMRCALSCLSRANGPDDDYDTRRNDVFVRVPPDVSPPTTIPWLPVSRGEQLCNLVGRWRILQRIASHRWTTDDLVTAYVAASTFVDRWSLERRKRGGTIRYLDLGTGNGSVLQMVTWYLLSNWSGDGSDAAVTKSWDLKAVGVEARSEAVGLARRSLSFNLDSVEYGGKVYSGMVARKSSTGVEKREPMKCGVRVVHGDFRDLISLSRPQNGQDSPTHENEELRQVSCRHYDLITGTPPYFRVDFSSSTRSEKNNSTDNIQEEVITAAIIRQGGMPTSMQSAPARCEFRGGVEAYCETASAMLAPEGIFVVCENWLNNDRVWDGAKNAGLEMDVVWPIMGKVGKKNPLFAVYVMRKQKMEQRDLESHVKQQGEDVTIRPPIAVRDENGKWTSGYAKIMDAMSIPVP